MVVYAVPVGRTGRASLHLIEAIHVPSGYIVLDIFGNAVAVMCPSYDMVVIAALPCAMSLRRAYIVAARLRPPIITDSEVLDDGVGWLLLELSVFLMWIIAWMWLGMMTNSGISA